LLGDNVAAAQRAIATLAADGWIRPASGRPTRWELTAHIHTIAQHAYGSHDLRRRARAELEELWRKTGETVLLSVPDGGRFIVIDVLESPHYLRSAPPVGMVVQPRWSATGRAMLPFMSPEEQANYLGGPPDAAMREDFAEIGARGYAISEGDVVQGSTNIAAPIFESDRRPVGAVLISAPSDRAGAEDESTTDHEPDGIAAHAAPLPRGQLDPREDDTDREQHGADGRDGFEDRLEGTLPGQTRPAPRGCRDCQSRQEQRNDERQQLRDVDALD
jgi:IclR family acetate operon transcriptional repressor